ncbi:hypothetical protein [Paenibacillus radicis (ex Xue et al. 2023)]|uniref:Uncharacterized protein n=1 Tax=Paenibacillus radicis (ex Xue et al. 2023) TaxID=2972489 RepID=A0ABT1YU85_9BACL|nr:hypothetical protein [Paenibacillus radicis (ex Xue et al. 2023)]MCR8636582.1 hypothetical protein [Paenibacillus radicis (ex Xue et al. 2023)]
MNTNTAKEEIQEQLGELDALFVFFYEWLAGQYDPATGGFYYARSSYDMVNFIPDIESTAQAVNIIERSGLLNELPERVRQGLIAFFQNKQDADSGYFYDADDNMRKDEVMVGRALGYSTRSLQKLGGQPLYTLPHKKQEPPAFMQSPDAYVEWLKSVDLRNSWRGCDLMCAPNHHVASLNEQDRHSYVEAAAAYFASMQDPETGLWGGGNLYIRISGTFKLNMFYKRFGVPVPHLDRIFRTIQLCLRTEEAIDMCWIRNPLDLLEAFREELKVPADEYAEIMRISVANMKKLLRSDGGFSRELKHSPPAPNVAQVKEGEFYPYMPVAVPIGLGRVEGDMNAGTQALWIRQIGYELGGFDHEPLEYAHKFRSAIEARLV